MADLLARGGIIAAGRRPSQALPGRPRLLPSSYDASGCAVQSSRRIRDPVAAESPVSAARLAVSVMPLENRRETLLAVASGADRRGYDGFFLPETWAFDVTLLLAEAALATERITLGTGIVSVWSRSAGTLAMAAATLSAISRGRFVLGL